MVIKRVIRRRKGKIAARKLVRRPIEAAPAPKLRRPTVDEVMRGRLLAHGPEFKWLLEQLAGGDSSALLALLSAEGAGVGGDDGAKGARGTRGEDGEDGIDGAQARFEDVAYVSSQDGDDDDESKPFLTLAAAVDSIRPIDEASADRTKRIVFLDEVWNDIELTLTAGRWIFDVQGTWINNAKLTLSHDTADNFGASMLPWYVIRSHASGKDHDTGYSGCRINWLDVSNVDFAEGRITLQGVDVQKLDVASGFHVDLVAKDSMLQDVTGDSLHYLKVDNCDLYGDHVVEKVAGDVVDSRFRGGFAIETTSTDPMGLLKGCTFEPACFWDAGLQQVRMDGSTAHSALQNDLAISGDGLNVVSAAGIDVQIFAADGTWTKPANTQMVKFMLFAGGGGGGAGRRGAAGTLRGGGGGGGGGGSSYMEVLADTLGNTEVVDIGLGGLGAGAGVADDADGAVGNAGSNSTFGPFAATGGAGGGGGTSAIGGFGGAPGSGASIQATTNGGTGGAGGAGAAGVASPDSAFLSARAGSGGGGISAGNVDFAGAVGGARTSVIPMAGGTAGAAGGGGVGGNGGAGGNVVGAGIVGPSWAGTGGGGGGGGTGGGGRGGAGGRPGGGGGGGGAAANGATVGQGGAGAAGYCVVVSYFGPTYA